MIVAGATLPPDNVRLLATLLEGELSAKLKRAVANENPVVAISPAYRECIVAALADKPTSGFAEFTACLSGAGCAGPVRGGSRLRGQPVA